MSRERTGWASRSFDFGHVPADLSAVLVWTALTVVAVVLPGVRETPLRTLVGLPFVLFVPGYAFVAALFPEAGSGIVPSATGSDGRDERGFVPVAGNGITGLERIVLSIGTSIAFVSLLGLGANFSPWGVRVVPVTLSIGGFTFVATSVATVRRLQVPETERFGLPLDRWLDAVRSAILDFDTRRDAAVNVLLVASILAATASVAFAVAVPRQDESFTEFYLLAENETGELVAGEYPTNYTYGEEKPLHVGISNHEHRPTNYTVVVELQRVKTTNDSTRVVATRRIQRFDVALEADEERVVERTVAPTMTGDDLRLRFLLYRGDRGVRADSSTALRELHLWVNVSRPVPPVQSVARPRSASFQRAEPETTEI